MDTNLSKISESKSFNTASIKTCLFIEALAQSHDENQSPGGQQCGEQRTAIKKLRHLALLFCLRA